MSGVDFTAVAGKACMFVVKVRVFMRIDDRPCEEQEKDQKNG